MVTDLQETIEAIVKASDLPLSILIVGVGGADFKEMEVQIFVPVILAFLTLHWFHVLLACSVACLFIISILLLLSLDKDFLH